jgi:hypothetical protein
MNFHNNITEFEINSVSNLKNILIYFFKLNSDSDWINDIIEIINKSTDKKYFYYHLNLMITQLDRLKKYNNIYTYNDYFYRAHILLKILLDIINNKSDTTFYLLQIFNKNKKKFLDLNIDFMYDYYLKIIKYKCFRSANIIHSLLSNSDKYEKVIQLIFSNKNINYKKYRTIRPLKLFKLLNYNKYI